MEAPDSAILSEKTPRRINREQASPAFCFCIGDGGRLGEPSRDATLYVDWGRCFRNILKELSANLARNGGNPQRAVNDFLNSPQSSKYITDLALSGRDPTEVMRRPPD